MADTLSNALFGPLDKSYCDYFFFLSVFFYIMFILAFVFNILEIFTTRNKLTFGFFFKMFIACAYPFVYYFQNRLLHNMCMR